MEYDEILSKLRVLSDEKFRVFNERIVNVESGKSIGVRIPQLRKLAKQLVCAEGFSFEKIFAYPNEYFEIRVLKCLCAGYARLTYKERVEMIKRCIPVIDGWAVETDQKIQR